MSTIRAGPATSGGWSGAGTRTADRAQATNPFNDALSGPRWISYRDRDDPIAWPVEPLMQGRDRIVRDDYIDLYDLRIQFLLEFPTRPDQVETMKVINVQEAKTQLSRLMDAAAGGEEIILGKHGKPMVRLSSFTAPTLPRRLGGREKEIRIAEDFDQEDARINAMFK